ncbi:MAG TPA: biotin carboxylase N-terminal domain-containing protein [Solirubrobacteraceae bacterium]|nr:biotin carboxylase N-terminal domain-containing protein [Solirubrobacteraceae bacterium]
MDQLAPVLIANRGEIVVRIARTVHGLGLTSAGVITPADAGALHADAVDVAVPVSSYLDPAELLRAARAAGARSVHPGYGFLSENAAFARAVIDAGLIWIGPPPEAIELMGDKARAKDAARAAEVPVVPSGEDGMFPVLVKAVAGGGGRGMRVVRRADALADATAAAAREAQAAFGDGRVMVERYIERPRHIEIQVLADRHGAVVHLGERECSLQRRHQKVVEEAPSPVVDPALRERLGAGAAALTRACGYEGVGTVEFIATSDAREFYFLEMNTRLQVEHPVTELVYGVDLVELQLRIAAGQPIALRQDELAPTGHAVEARLYAEDPAGGFLPATGVIRAYREPGGAGIRVDSGVRAGTEIGTSYDPMLAKVIAHGPDRATALRRLRRALAEFELVGVRTNAAFTRALLARDDVRAGAQDTGLLERVLAEAPPPTPEDLLPAAALVAAGTATPAGPWRRKLVDHGEVRVQAGQVSAGERVWDGVAMRLGADGAARVRIGGVERRYAFYVSDEEISIARDGHQLELHTARSSFEGEGALIDSLQAPMPGTVLIVRVADGDTVAKGDVLLVLESMKMELSITAPHAGTVDGLHLKPGDRVARGQPVLAVHAEEAPHDGHRAR